MRPDDAPIVKKAEQLMLEIADAVSVFPKRYKYIFGEKLTDLSICAVIAARDYFYVKRDVQRQFELMSALSGHIKQINQRLRIAAENNCYRAERYGLLSRISRDLGRQCGGLLKRAEEHLKGQSPAVPNGGSVP